MNSLPVSKQQNVSLNDRLTNLLIEEWSIEIDYSKYFTACASTFCTYTKTDEANFSYTVSLLLSLYGGLVIMLRLIAISLVNISFKLKRRSINTTFNTGMFLL
jgi:hypothetical protein